MDTHKNLKDLTDEGIAAAHQKDLEVQDKYGVNYLKYWYNKDLGIVHCLVESPSEDAAERVRYRCRVFLYRTSNACSSWDKKVTSP